MSPFQGFHPTGTMCFPKLQFRNTVLAYGLQGLPRNTCFKSIIYIVLALKLCIKTGLIDMDTIKVLITNQKGGVGKSTISANLAAYLAIQESKKVSLIDFDKQSSASRWASKAPNIGLEIHQANLEYKNSGLTLLDARAMLRNFSLNADICIADLTWTHAIPYEFLLDFDLIF